MIEIVVGKSTTRKRARSLFIETWAETDEDAVNMTTKLARLPEVVEIDSNNFEIPYRHFNDVLDELDEWELHIYGDLDRNVQQYIESRNRISSTEETEFQFKTEPFSHQIECFEYAKEHPCFLLGDEQGLGKTKQAIDIAVSRKNAFKHCLIVCCISGLKWNWAKEVEIHSNQKAYILGSRVNKKNELVIDGVAKMSEDLLQHQFF